MGTVRAECLDWVLVWNRWHLRRVVSVTHYNTGRPHRGINLDVPTPRAGPTKVDTSPGATGRIARVDILGGLIREYRRAA